MNDGDDRPRVHVLIVEDNPHMQLLLRHLLEFHFDLALVESVEEALDLASRQRFDLLLFDINLGGGKRSGLDLLDVLRRTTVYGATPAVACTAYGRQSDREHFLAHGFDHYVAKPFTREQLYKTIEAALAFSSEDWPAAA